MSIRRDTRRLPAILFGIAFGTAVGILTLPPENRSELPSDTSEHAATERDANPQGQLFDETSATTSATGPTASEASPSQTVATALEDPATQKREAYEQLGKAIFEDSTLFREYISDLVSRG
jgi:hypothetical protein